MNPYTASTVFQGGIKAQALAQHLIEAGVSFEYEPYPDDCHRFAVKPEVAWLLPASEPVPASVEDE